MLIIIDGPEAAGKSTLIDAMMTELAGQNPSCVHFGPVTEWIEFSTDLETAVNYHPRPTIWDRSWSSEVVYNVCMNRGRDISREGIMALEAQANKVHATKILLVPPAEVLTKRRAERGPESGDLPVLPSEERYSFLEFAREWGWMYVTGVHKPERLARSIIALARMKGTKSE